MSAKVNSTYSVTQVTETFIDVTHSMPIRTKASEDGARARARAVVRKESPTAIIRLWAVDYIEGWGMRYRFKVTE